MAHLMLPFLLVGMHLKGTWKIEQSPDGPSVVQTDYGDAFAYTEKWENGQLRELTRDELERECARWTIPVDDPWDVAASFLALHTPADLLSFLNRTGTFSVATDPLRLQDMSEPTFLVESFWALQDVLKEMLRSRNPVPEIEEAELPQDWEDAFKQSMILSFEKAFRETRIVVRADLTLPLMIAAIQTKIAQGLRFKFCKRPDCRRPFPVISGHKRLFCQQYCAHLHSLRERRGTRVGRRSSKAPRS